MTSNLAQSEVIDCGTNRKRIDRPTYSYQWSIATWTYLAPFQSYGGLNIKKN